MNEVLTRLEERGLARRHPDRARGRVRPAELTAAGRRLLAKADRSVDAVEDGLFGSVDVERFRGLLAEALRDVDGAP